MSYRTEWQKCKQYFPRVYCWPMIMGFRVVTDKNDPTAYKEINSLGNGDTRQKAWEDAARWVEQVYANKRRSNNV